MESVIGIKGKDFVVIGAERMVSNSIIVLKNEHDKIESIKDRLLVTSSGDRGDMLKLLRVFKYETITKGQMFSKGLTVNVASNVFQNQIHKSLRRKPYQTNVMIAGKADDEYKLVRIDMYGTMNSDDFMVLGVPVYFCYGILDGGYSKDITVEGAIALIERCYKALKERCTIKNNVVEIKVVNDSGVQATTVSV